MLAIFSGFDLFFMASDCLQVACTRFVEFHQVYMGFIQTFWRVKWFLSDISHNEKVPFGNDLKIFGFGWFLFATTTVNSLWWRVVPRIPVRTALMTKIFLALPFFNYLSLSSKTPSRGSETDWTKSRVERVQTGATNGPRLRITKTDKCNCFQSAWVHGSDATILCGYVQWSHKMLSTNWLL